MRYLRDYIEAQISINEEEWQTISQFFTKKSYKKGDELFSAGDICQNLFYLSSGVLRMYSISTEGKDLTWAVNYNKQAYQLDPFSGDYISYLTQNESNFFIEALEDSTVYKANFSELDLFYQSDIKWMTLAKKISDLQLVTLVQRVEMMKRLTAKEKYELMKEVAPIYEEVLPDYQYATVLGITPQSLSRIKKN